MRCSERAALRARACWPARAARWSRSPARAHKASDAYLQIDGAAGAARAALGHRAARPRRRARPRHRRRRQADWGEVTARLAAHRGATRCRACAIDGCALRAGGPRPRAAQRRRLCGAAACRRAARSREPPAIALRAASPRSTRPTAASPRSQRAGQAVALTVLDPTCAALGRRRAAAPTARRAGGGRPRARRPSRWQFLAEGVRHILTGYDHVLFLLCLLLPAVMRRTPAGWQPVERAAQAVWPVAGIVTAFTVAHSITLALAALKLVSLPPAFIEPAIAVTIVLAALDNVRPIFPVRRVVVAFVLRPDPRLRLRRRAGRAGPADRATSPGRCCSSTSGSSSASC